MQLAIGQKVWWVPSQSYRASRNVEVIKVGRRWATLSNGCRVDIGSGYAEPGTYDGGGRIYLSQEAQEQETKAQVVWDALRRLIATQYRIPVSITPQRMAEIEAMIFGQKGESMRGKYGIHAGTIVRSPEEVMMSETHRVTVQVNLAAQLHEQALAIRNLREQLAEKETKLQEQEKTNQLLLDRLVDISRQLARALGEEG